MASINWDEIDNNDFKSYARSGKHTTTVKVVELGEPSANKGSVPIIVSFNENDEHTFSNARYWLSKENDMNRIRTARNVLIALGVEKNAAQKAVENAEDKADYDKKIAVYEQAFNRAGQKHSKVEIECWETDRISEKSGKPYTATGFTTEELAWMNGNDISTTTTTESVVDEAVETDDISIDQIPF